MLNACNNINHSKVKPNTSDLQTFLNLQIVCSNRGLKSLMDPFNISETWNFLNIRGKKLLKNSWNTKKNVEKLNDFIKPFTRA